jgi:succinoglycan biosynthesis protein ExoU
MQVGFDTRTAVIIAAYNAAGTLARAVHSALAERETVEICIVDDASKDDTAAVAHALAAADARVSFFQQEGNAGPAAARNRAINATTAPWLSVLDADDYFLPGRLEKLHRLTSECEFVSGQLIRIHEGDAIATLPPTLPGSRQLSFSAFVEGNFNPQFLDLGFLKPVFSRAFLNAHGLRYDESLRLGEDYEFYARAIAFGARFVLLDGPAGYASVIRAGSLSRDHSEEDLQRMRDCDTRLAALPQLTDLDRRTLRRHWASVDCRLQWRRLISAVKAHDIGAAGSTFRSPQVARYLATRLAEQAWLRSVGRLFHKAGA